MPGVTLMRHLRFPTKLGVLSIALIAPLMLITVVLLGRLNADIRVTQDELQGTELVAALRQVMREVQQHRGQTNMVLAGNATAREALAETRQRLTAQTTALDRELAALPAFKLLTDWAPLKSQIEALAATEQLPASQAFVRHTELIQSLRQLIYTTAERSSLLFDPVPASYFLMDLTVSHTPVWAETLGQIRDLGAGLRAQPEPDPAGLQTVMTLVEVASKRTEDMAYLQRFLQHHGQGDLNPTAALGEVRGFLAEAERALASPDRGAAPAFFSAGTQAIDSVASYERLVGERLNMVLGERLLTDTWQRNAALASAILGVSLISYLMWCFYFSFVVDFRRVIAGMTETADGNLRVQVTSRGSDELSDLTRLLGRLNSNLSMMVAEVRSNSALVAQSGQSLASGNRALADRTEQQAANLEQTAASVQELSSTVHQNAQTAGDSDTQAAQVRDVAESGGMAMTQAVDSVAAIQKGAQQMNEIIGVIDSLAFQTNILALNAAVEAARAGEQGRGFAVVANEVRTLAQRSAGAAREIRGLIQTSGSQVDESVKRMRVAGDNMAQIVSGVRGVAANMSLISAASAEQSTGLIQISSAVGQLDQITQRNAQMVERAVQQADQLASRAGELARAVANFQLQQGTAEEAMALVVRALEHRQSLGGERFTQSLTDPQSGFHDRDMYVFALDGLGSYRAFGGKPEKLGSRVQDIPGVDGQALLEAIVAQAEHEPGWVEYNIVNPQTGKVQTKMSYVTRIDDLYVGCGVYKSAPVSA
jgi:methyl-accepting chemotaxis protein